MKGKTAFLAASMLAVCAPAGAQSSAMSPTAPSISDRQQVVAVAERVAKWQLANQGDFPYVTKYPDETMDTRGWVQAAFYIGLSEWARASGSAEHKGTLQRFAQDNDFRLGRMIYHADDQAVGRVYTSLVRDGLADRRALAPMRAAFDAVLVAPSKHSLEFKGKPRGRVECVSERWCWCDALFMAPPTWFALANLTGQNRYREFANREFWATTDYLFDKDSGLYFRDSRFFTMRGEQGEKLFWSRGNGWVMGGLVQLLAEMPRNYPDRPRYEDILRKMAVALKNAQQPSGFWGSSLLQKNAPPESSGTAFFVYGLERGIALGLLKESDFRPVIERGWKALLTAVQPDGRLGYVQQIGDRPDAVRPEDTQLYGSGAFLLASSARLQATSSPIRSR
jgi:rhamnogalacturonyl hydrolase YesR